MLSLASELRALTEAIERASIEVENAKETSYQRTGTGLENRNKILKWLNERNRPATMTEICAHFGFNKGTGNFYARRMLDDEWLEIRNVNGKRMFGVKA